MHAIVHLVNEWHMAGMHRITISTLVGGGFRRWPAASSFSLPIGRLRSAMQIRKSSDSPSKGPPFLVYIPRLYIADQHSPQLDAKNPPSASASNAPVYLPICSIFICASFRLRLCFLSDLLALNGRYGTLTTQSCFGWV